MELHNTIWVIWALTVMWLFISRLVGVWLVMNNLLTCPCGKDYRSNDWLILYHGIKVYFHKDNCLIRQVRRPNV